MKSACFTLVALSLFLPHLSYGQVVLENPQPGQTLTGVGLVSGWACEAEEITVRLTEDAPIQPVPYGGSRLDTIPTCQNDGLNSFSLLVNWNNLGAGPHTMTLFVDGHSVGSRDIEVITFGEEFMTDVEKTVTVSDWPDWRTDVQITWNEAKQNFEIVAIDRFHIPPAAGDLGPLLGRWYFQTEEEGFWWMETPFTEIDGEQVTGTVHSGWPIFGRLNTTRWLGQPLMQYEIYYLIDRVNNEGTFRFCHVYVFNFDTATNTAKGYYWDGIGSTLEECEQNQITVVGIRFPDGPYRASGGKYEE